ncbi:acyl-CoA dehydrogenase family protein [Saccharothrix sp. NRRL B-16314]|uniref:acyl-CoA dehydrogenase family protein n=1 Tax=Saccharothrix sp. NRRL B-16314 TaxID=1463825 RepID=UPI000AEDF595|nr:acyl-CoA dehydrogenase family protein [Saccharothrix sp. NRRL B-16314]
MSGPMTAESLAAFTEGVAEFARTRVAPRAAGMDAKAAYDPELLTELRDAGLLGIEVPEHYGGLGGGLRHTLAAIEELAVVDPSVAVLVDVQNALVAAALLRHGSRDQQRRWLPPLAAGTVAAFALSEDGAGSDAFAMTTRAEPVAGGYRIDGAKAWITSAAEAGLFLVCARTGGALTLFLVSADTPGLRVGPRVDTLGVRASSTCPVWFDGVVVPEQDVLGGPGHGAELVMAVLDIGKLGIAAQQVGLARGALDHALRHAATRRQFGRPIGAFQGVRFPLARAAVEIDAASALLGQAVDAVERGVDPTARMRACAGAKLFCAEVAERTATLAVDVLGGLGYTADSPVARLHRDAKVGGIYEGTTNIQLRTVAATLLAVPEAAGRDEEGNPGR